MKKPSPLISIIVPVYNVERYLNRCVDSILTQTYKNIEIILVDDGTPDNSGNIADIYAKNHKCVKVVHRKNGGLSAARNTGIDHSAGDYLSFVDSDDYVEPNFITSLYDLVKNNDSKISMCDVIYEYEDGSTYKNDPIFDKKMLTMSSKQMIEQYLKSGSANAAPAWNKLFHKSLFIDTNIRFPEGKLYEDISIICELFYAAKEISYTSSQLYHYIKYRNNGKSITNKKIKQHNLNDFNDALQNTIKFVNSHQEFSKKDLSTFVLSQSLAFMNLMRINGVDSSSIARQQTQKIREYYKQFREHFDIKTLKKRYRYELQFIIRFGGTNYIKLKNSIDKVRTIRR